MNCPKCKKQIDGDSKFCEFCGEKITTHQITNQNQVRTKFEIKKYIEKNKFILIIVFLVLLVVTFIIIAIDLHSISTHIAPKSLYGQ